MRDTDIAAELGKFPTGNLCNAHPEVRAMDSAILPLFSGARLSGPAKTALVVPGQNAAIHRALHTATPGDVLVVDAGASMSHGPFGDLMSTCCIDRGIVGLVIDGAVRDSDEIAELKFPIFSRGRNPSATKKTDPGEIDLEITCGGVRVRHGDMIVGDCDGVVVIPQEITGEMPRLVAEVAEREEAIRKQMDQGKTTAEIFGLID